MKLAVLGNSHAVCVILAHREDRANLGPPIAPRQFASGSRRVETDGLRPGNDMSHMNSAFDAIYLRYLREEIEAIMAK